jgi:IMP dehydrogenase/GMP reductase
VVQKLRAGHDRQAHEIRIVDSEGKITATLGISSAMQKFCDENRLDQDCSENHTLD